MKKLITLLVVAVVSATPSLALAQHRGHHVHGPKFHHHHVHARYWHPHYGWVAPVIIGGAVTYAMTRPAPVVIEQPIVQHIDQPALTCTPWVETKQPDGSVVQTRTCQ